MRKGVWSAMRAGFLNAVRSHLKNAFWPNICVGFSFQVLDILEYVCGLKLGPALILNQNPIFEMASILKRLHATRDILLQQIRLTAGR